jgi:glucose-6-phosphate dehydrogenase assembly protein OpcA
MPTAYKVLGQSAPSATTDTTLYTVPSSTSAVVSTISVCNRDTASGTFRIAVRPAGASIANQHYVVYDAELGANATATFTLGVTLATTDVVTVRASTANFSFSAFGSEIS